MKNLTLFSDERMLDHKMGAHHPECPERLQTILDAVGKNAYQSTESASEEAIGRVHAPGYVSRILGLRSQSARLDPDTAVSPGSVQAAQLAAGAAVAAVDAVLDCESRRAWSLVRPPGHHAEHNQAMGFCLFNNVAIAAEHALARGLRKIAIVDFDVHHGNGTQHHFYERADVLVINLHRHPFYPGTGGLDLQGRGDGEGFNINIPFEKPEGDATYRDTFERIVLPVLREYSPELVLVSAGFDAHEHDPLGGMQVSTSGFAWMTAALRDFADMTIDGRLMLTLEGGYELEALRDSVLACRDVLEGGDVPDIPITGSESVDRALQEHDRFWDSL